MTPVFKRFLIVGISILLLSSCIHYVKYHEGLNTVYLKNRLFQEIYIYNGFLNGVFVQYSDSPDIAKMGTYYSNKRNGLWDTLLNGTGPAQIYYVNDSPSVKMDNICKFQFSISPSVDFTFLDPIGWKRFDSLPSNAVFLSYSESPNYSDRVHGLTCAIYKVDSSQALLNMYKNHMIDKIKDSTFIISEVINPNQLVTKEYKVSDTIITTSKLIKTSKGRYGLYLSCWQSDYPYCKYMFNTMVNSFNPISDTRQ